MEDARIRETEQPSMAQTLTEANAWMKQNMKMIARQLRMFFSKGLMLSRSMLMCAFGMIDPVLEW